MYSCCKRSTLPVMAGQDSACKNIKVIMTTLHVSHYYLARPKEHAVQIAILTKTGSAISASLHPPVRRLTGPNGTGLSPTCPALLATPPAATAPRWPLTRSRSSQTPIGCASVAEFHTLGYHPRSSSACDISKTSVPSFASSCACTSCSYDSARL